MTLPFTEKYRPQTFDEIYSHETIKLQLEKFIEQSNLPHLLFFGPAGTGKTTMVHALARVLFGSDYRSKIIELNASDDNGIDVVRERIIQFVETKHLFRPKGASAVPERFQNLKLIILDECDQMSSIAQAALRRVMETSAQHARFVLLCNYVSKIISPLESRCARFRFRPIPAPRAVEFLSNVCLKESIPLEQCELNELCELCRGDLRQTVNLLQFAHSARNYDFYAICGRMAPESISQLMDIASYSEKVEQITSIINNGISLEDAVTVVFQDIVRGQRVDADKIIALAEIEENLLAGATLTSQIAGLASVLVK